MPVRKGNSSAFPCQAKRFFNPAGLWIVAGGRAQATPPESDSSQKHPGGSAGSIQTSKSRNPAGVQALSWWKSPGVAPPGYFPQRLRRSTHPPGSISLLAFGIRPVSPERRDCARLVIRVIEGPLSLGSPNCSTWNNFSCISIQKSTM